MEKITGNLVLKFLNQPVVIWFLTSVIIGGVSWQYTNIQKNSAEEKRIERNEKRVKLELFLLSQTIQFVLENPDDMTVGKLQHVGSQIIYNSHGKNSPNYFPALLNIMLELEVYDPSKNGIDLYSQQLLDITGKITKAVTRNEYRIYNPLTQRVWPLFTKKEQSYFNELNDLVTEISDYYRHSQ